MGHQFLPDMFSKKDKIIIFSLLIIIIIFGFIFFRNKYSKDIKAAIIPHHLLAKDLIEDLGQRVSRNKKIRKVFIIGPNHDEIGKGPLLTDSNQLKSNFLILDKETIEKDHSCWAPRSILQKYFSNVEINCILISSKANIVELQEIAKEISFNNQETLVVISTDFSHYLTKDEADKNDITTQDLISQKNVDSILRLNNGFVDSPKSLAFLFFYLKNINNIDQKILNHLNSSQILNQPNLASTTSYFEIIFY